MIQTLFPGVVFRLEAGSIRARVTTRADRFADRIEHQRRRADDHERARRLGNVVGLRPTIEIVGVIRTRTSATAVALEATLRRTFCRPGSGGTYTSADVSAVLVYCRRKGLRVHGLQGDRVEKPALRKPVIEVRAVPDPTIPRETLIEQITEQESDEQAQIGRHIAERRRDRRSRTGSALRFSDEARPGYQYAGINLSEAIGGFARVSGRTHAQTEAAMQLRRLADQAQLGGARAVDYTAAKVDTSGPTASAVVDNGASARAQYYDACKRVGLRTDRLAAIELLVVAGTTVSAAAAQMGYGSSGPARKKVRMLALEAATVLAIHFGNLAGHRRSVRFDGDRPTDPSTPRSKAA